MKASLRYVVGGAVLGTILGAIGGMFYSRRADIKKVAFSEIDRSQLFHLGTSFIGILRQIVELSGR